MSGHLDKDIKEYATTTDEFMMYCFKVVPCCKNFCHDWWVCPFAHGGEKAKRRDPRRSRYAAIACPDVKQGRVCPRGDSCPGTHNVFEYWLHPSRFRTEFCGRGIHCTQPFCFFAHSMAELRQPPANSFVDAQGDRITDTEVLMVKSGAESSARPSRDPEPQDLRLAQSWFTQPVASLPQRTTELITRPLRQPIQPRRVNRQRIHTVSEIPKYFCTIPEPQVRDDCWLGLQQPSGAPSFQGTLPRTSDVCVLSSWDSGLMATASGPAIVPVEPSISESLGIYLRMGRGVGKGGIGNTQEGL